jgi:Polyketide cyclase / dehydrase and lipid transport
MSSGDGVWTASWVTTDRRQPGAIVAEYSFVTIWRVEAPIEGVFAAIRDSAAWPTWWPAVTAVQELEAGGDNGIGNLSRYTFKGKLPYTLTFDLRVDRVEEPTALGGVATGELAGTGIWTLTAEGPGTTTVRYDWNVRTTRWWMNLFAPLAGGLFRDNHDFVMSDGRRGLGRLLGVEITNLRAT